MNFKNLDVYKCAIQFLSLAYKIIESCKKGNADLVDQLRRASVSIPLNIAEATGKTGLLDRKRYFSIARGSAMECSAILDVIVILKLYSIDDELKESQSLLIRIVEMLTKLCR